MRTPDRYFDEMYADSLDPWGYESTWYERRKYALTLAALPREYYRRGFEAGCSNGVLTSLLAQRCGTLVANDLHERVADKARERNPGVDIRSGRIPEDWPEGDFDLVVLSEVLYYLSPLDLPVVFDKLSACDLVVVHWRGVTNYPMTGDQVHGYVAEQPWRRLVDHREKDFLLAVYEVP